MNAVKSAVQERCVTFAAVVADAFDGAARMLGDAQRFGFIVRVFHLDAADGSAATIRLTLGIPSDADAAVIRSRLARHETVVSLELC